ncbi:MAG TPA: macro domain-containing protein [Aggregatilinea sp.]|uniref:macro domain-containing protein n=1 Tax=Aggregatilinea sp. TaxID=2806333 RepID=UPI002C053FB6|nr:macro domain-containing protein [Aggregatilinea sp.]HML21263.1 macro domain-containing protein [Aggregatilinea sp.]
MRATVNGVVVALMQGDITDLDVDAIVNAANSELILGAGVAGAIRRKGGPDIQVECLAIGYCEVGSAVITGGGNLLARHVIHAVGPRMGEGSESGKLGSAVRTSLDLAEENGLHSIAFPAISTGVFGYPLEACADVMLRVILDYTYEDLENLEQVIVCLYDDRAFGIFEDTFSRKLEQLQSG